MTTATELKPLERIPLSKERLELIFEMCKIVFPEYREWFRQEFGFIGYWFWDGSKMALDSIYWLELCLTHLPDEMYGEEQTFLSGGQFVTAREYVMARMNSGIHPVSSLYEKVFAEYKSTIKSIG